MAMSSEETAAELAPATTVWPDTDAAFVESPAPVEGGWPVVTEIRRQAEDEQRRTLYALAKRVLDVAVASLALVIVAPLLALICLVIRLESPGPAMLAQPRIGRGRRPFRMYKLRTMTGDAPPPDELLARNEADSLVFKIRDDPRLTRVGRFLRRTSLDELPQLFNVLRGEMSLVGPRPPLDYEVDRYGAHELQRLRVLPGMTGLWQVEGRSDLPFATMVDLDMDYIRRRSLLLDLLLLIRTVPAVLSMRGAY